VALEAASIEPSGLSAIVTEPASDTRSRDPDNGPRSSAGFRRQATAAKHRRHEKIPAGILRFMFLVSYAMRSSASIYSKAYAFEESHGFEREGANVGVGGFFAG
jgi:hypothetical protein